MKILKIAAVVVAVIVVGVVAVLMTFNVDQYKGMIEEQAKVATGRNVTIGDIDLAVSLTPAIVLTDVKLANAPWGSRPEMVILPRVEVHTQLIPLLFGTINLTELTAENPDILLEIDKQGRGNWVFDVASEGSSTPLNVSGVSVNGLKLGYRDAQAGRSADVTAKAIAVNIDGALQDMNISSVAAKTAEAVFKNGQATGKLAVGAFEMKAKGKIADLGITSLNVADTTLNYKSAGAPLDLVVSGLSIAEDGKVNFAGKMSGENVTANGTLAPIAVLVAMNKAFPAKLEMTGYGLTASSDLTVEMVKGRPFAKGTIAIPELDVAKFGGAAPAKSDGRMFSAEPLPWDGLNAVDADVTLKIGKMTNASGVEFADISIPVKANRGRMTAAPVTLAVAGGTVSADVGLNASDKTMTLKVQGKGFSAEGLAKTFKKGDVITQGPIDMALDVRGTGNSMRDVMASLDGSLIAGMGESRIRNDALSVPGAGVILQVLNMANPFANKDPYTVARCGVANFQIADGIAQSNQSVVLVTDKMSITSTGQIDLRNERLDLNVRTQGASGVAGGLNQLAQAVKVTGSLSSPSVGVDQAGVVKGVAGLGSALAKGGGSGLGGIGALFGIGSKSGTGTAQAAPADDLCARARAYRKG
ncbi:MAG: AsmA family protein [Proteobacteria bacterium]|nr:AsmA family protein [Pseudomonadota bacterium]